MIEQNERIAQETGTDLQTAWTKISKNNQRKGMNQNTQKKHQNQTMYRAVFYIVGLLTLALGIILNTKSGLGVSPIISVAFSISTIGGLNFGNTTFGLYIVFVLVELLLHTVSYRNRYRKWRSALSAGGTGTGYPAAAAQPDLYPFYESVFCMDSGLGHAAVAAPYVGWRYHLHGNRRCHVAEYANYPESRRRNRAGDRGLYSPPGRLYEELLRSAEYLHHHHDQHDFRASSDRNRHRNRCSCPWRGPCDRAL